MSRMARKNYCSCLFHIMIQGINKEYIFNTKDDKRIFLKILKEKLKEQENINVISYCIMDNHAHLLIQSEDVNNISKFMQKVNTKYAIFYNKKYNRCGYVFRDRYKGEDILSNSHLINCIRYIHNNPVKAGMYENEEDYTFSSYNELKNKCKEYIIKVEEVKKILELYEIDFESIFEKYDDLIEFIDCDNDDDIDTKIKLCINQFKEQNQFEIDNVKYNFIVFRNIVEDLYYNKNIKQKEIAKYFNVSSSKISKILSGKTGRCR